jgi:hypothetical protein
MESFTIPKLKSIVGDLTMSFSNNSNLTFASFPELKSITGLLSLKSSSYSINSKFADISGFSSLSSADGVTIEYFSGLKDFEPLKNVIPSIVSGQWKITGCGYNPTLQNMRDGKYVPQE